MKKTLLFTTALLSFALVSKANATTTVNSKQEFYSGSRTYDDYIFTINSSEALYISSATVNVTNSVFKDADSGSSNLITSMSGTTSISNSTFTNNTTSSSAFISNSSGNMTFTNVVFSNNTLSSTSSYLVNSSVTSSDLSTTFENVTFLNNVGTTSSYAINATNGTVNLTNVTFQNESMGAIKVNGGSATVNLYGTITLASSTDTIYSTGEINVQSGATLINNGAMITSASPFYFYDNSTYQFLISKTGDAFNQEGAFINLADGNVYGALTLTPILASGVSDGSYIWTNSINTSSNTNITISNNLLYNISFTDDTYKILSIAQKTTNEIAQASGGTLNQANAAVSILNGTSANATFNTLSETLNTLMQTGNTSATLQLVDKISADTTSSAQSNSVTAAAQMFGVVGARLSGGSVGALSGQAGGSSTLNGLELWAQGMVNKTNLSGSNGFDSDSTGLAFGGEKQVNDTIKIGLGYGYTQTDISTSSRETDVDTHTFFAYGEYKPSAHFYNAILSYAFADYDENAGINASGYDVDSLAMQVMTGYEFYSKDVDVTPQIGLRYVNVSKDGYTDTFGSKVSGDTSDIFTAVIGAKVGKKYILENKTSVRPEAKLSLTYDMINDDSNAVVSLVNGTTYTTTGKALDEFGVEIAAGVAMDLSQKTELSLNYEGEFRKDYDSHTGLLNFKYKF